MEPCCTHPCPRPLPFQSRIHRLNLVDSNMKSTNLTQSNHTPQPLPVLLSTPSSNIHLAQDASHSRHFRNCQFPLGRITIGCAYAVLALPPRATTRTVAPHARKLSRPRPVTEPAVRWHDVHGAQICLRVDPRNIPGQWKFSERRFLRHRGRLCSVGAI